MGQLSSIILSTVIVQSIRKSFSPMAKKPDNPKRILRKLFEENKRHSNQINEDAKRLFELAGRAIDEFTKDPETNKSPTIGLHQPIKDMMRALLIAQSIMTLNSDNELDKPLLKAFSAAGLDHRNPLDWKLLLREFANAFFAPGRGVGAPRKWTGARYCRLLAHIHQLKLEKPSLKDRPACAILRKRQPEYRHPAVDHLRKLLRQARNPKFNDILSRLLEQFLIDARVRYLQENRPWTPEIEAELRKKLTANLIGWIKNNWLKKGSEQKIVGRTRTGAVTR